MQIIVELPTERGEWQHWKRIGSCCADWSRLWRPIECCRKSWKKNHFSIRIFQNNRFIYLHPDDGVDEEEHADQKANIGQCLNWDCFDQHFHLIDLHLKWLDKCPEQDANGVALLEQPNEAGRAEKTQKTQRDEVTAELGDQLLICNLLIELNCKTIVLTASVIDPTTVMKSNRFQPSLK